MRNFTEEEKQIIDNMYYEGYTMDQIANSVKSSRKTIGLYLAENNYPLRSRKQLKSIWNINVQRKHFFNEDFFHIIDNEHKAYWLGFLYADGCVDKNKNGIFLGLQAGDKSHLEKFLKDLDADDDYPIKTKIEKLNGKEYPQVYIQLHSLAMHTDLINCGCIPTKSLILKRPNLDKEFIPHFIRGYFDGDGTVSFNESTHYSHAGVLGTQDVLEFIKENSGISQDINIRLNKKGGNVMSLQITGFSNLVIFYNYIYNDCTICLDRKKDKFDKVKNDICLNHSKYSTASNHEDELLRMNYNGVAVVRISKDFKEIMIYKSQSVAARELNKWPASIGDCCRHIHKHVYGYYWLFYSEFVNIPPDELEQYYKEHYL